MGRYRFLVRVERTNSDGSVNCSGHVVSINVMILTSEFPIVVSGSKYM